MITATEHSTTSVGPVPDLGRAPTWALKAFSERGVVGWAFLAGMHPSAVAERFARDELTHRSSAEGTTWHVVVSTNAWAPSVPAARYELRIGGQGLRGFRRVS